MGGMGLGLLGGSQELGIWGEDTFWVSQNGGYEAKGC
jgi:hypothetical protein